MRAVSARTFNQWTYWNFLDWWNENDLAGDLGSGEVEVGDYRVSYFTGTPDDESYRQVLEMLSRPGSGWSVDVYDY